MNIGISIAIALASAPLGVFLVWNRLSFLGESISHSLLFCMVMSTFTGINSAIAMVIIANVCMYIIKKTHTRHHANNDLVIITATYGLTAIGLFLQSLTPNIINVKDFFIGNAQNITTKDEIPIYIISFIVLFIAKLRWKQWIIISIQPKIAHLRGINVRYIMIEYITLLSTFAACISKTTGMLFITSLITIPVITARIYSSSPERMVILSFAISIANISCGHLIAQNLSSALNPTIVTTMTFFLICTIMMNTLKKKYNAAKNTT